MMIQCGAIPSLRQPKPRLNNEVPTLVAPSLPTFPTSLDFLPCELLLLIKGHPSNVIKALSAPRCLLRNSGSSRRASLSCGVLIVSDPSGVFILPYSRRKALSPWTAWLCWSWSGSFVLERQTDAKLRTDLDLWKQGDQVGRGLAYGFSSTDRLH